MTIKPTISVNQDIEFDVAILQIFDAHYVRFKNHKSLKHIVLCH